MVFSEKQKQVTKDCLSSDEQDYWLIGATGNVLRPSNWPERIASTFMQLEEFSATKKLISECVSQTMVNGRTCLRVRKAFQQGCLGGWGYIENFAQSNKLNIVDNHGVAYQLSDKNCPSCPEIDSIAE